MNILITGNEGFIAKNLIFFLRERGFNEINGISRKTSFEEKEILIKNSDFIFHLAGVNRAENNEEFQKGNIDFLSEMLSILKDNQLKTPILYSSSTQAELNNIYGESKKKAEDLIINFAENNNSKYFIFRLPNIFGKWCKPNYNSFISTFCFNLHNKIKLEIYNPKSEVTLAYIDDICACFFDAFTNNPEPGYCKLNTTYKTTVGEVAKILESFLDREKLYVESVGNGLKRALYSTYISFYEPKDFSYKIKSNIDNRGSFSEFIKTYHSGQVSFFTAHPGITRGRHYHHTKTEKFLVVQGKAKFNFRNIHTNEFHTLEVSSEEPTVVETIPGWAHDITNIGDNELIAILWANEIFDNKKPDTFAKETI